MWYQNPRSSSSLRLTRAVGYDYLFPVNSGRVQLSVGTSMSVENEQSQSPDLQPGGACVGALGLPLPKYVPRRYKHRNVGSWSGHLAFANDLITAIRPRLIVELGTHWGEAYFTFCQTVQEEGLSSVCYAVDHWLGDEHAGHYGEEVFNDVLQYNERYYASFSYLLRSSFDDALPQFSDGSIDLLHIDGLHTYEAASNDFRKWLPKVKPGGIILLHDICPKHEEFGVWRLWEEITAEFRDTFEFHHGWGLGVLRKEGGTTTAPLLDVLFCDSPPVHEELRRRYSIYASHLDNLLIRTSEAAADQLSAQASSEIRVQVFPFGAEGYSEETSLFQIISPGSWTTLSFELPDGSGQAPLRVDPAHGPGLIEIAEITIHSLVSGELVWGGAASSAAKDLEVAGTASGAAGGAGMLLVSYGDDPQLMLKVPPTARGPVKLTVSLRVAPTPLPAPEMIYALIEGLVQQVQSTEQRVATANADSAGVRERLAQTIRERDQSMAEWAAERENEHSRLVWTENKLRESESVRMAMEHSLSWRVTAPVRKLMAAFRSGPRSAH